MIHRINLRARPEHHFAYSGRCVLSTNIHGAVTGAGGEGFYFENTRLLSRHELTVDGRPLVPVAASPVGGAGFLIYSQVPEGPNIPPEAVFIESAVFLGDGMRTEIRLENYAADRTPIFELAVHLAADFADTKETQQGQRQQTGEVETTWDEAQGELLFQYRHPELDRAVAIRVEQAPAPVRFEDGALVTSLALAPHGRAELHLVVEPVFDGKRESAPEGVFDETLTPLGRVRQQLRDEVPALVTTNQTVARAWQTAVADLASLPLGLEPGPATPAAGIPLYQYLFGRDTLTTAWQALMALPIAARDSLLANAAPQGRAIDDWRDEEPGKLIHQARQGPLSALCMEPFLRYYGDYAAPQDFLILLGQYLAWTNDRSTVRELLPAARNAIDWLDRYADLDGDGFIEYTKRSEKGVKNQGWKDAPDAIADERGEQVDNPIATSELQAYWYAGLQMAALSFLFAGDRAYALELLRKARDLRCRFDQAYWMEDEGFYALALGPDKRQVRSIASNTGHLLATGIVPKEKGPRVARRLMEPDLWSGWGIRTLSSDHPVYNPFSYHRGSVWPVENGTFVFGLGRYGCFEEMHRLAEGMFAATELFEENRLPESLGGLPRDPVHPHPGIYPRSNEPQSWSASMVVLLVQSLLGMRPMAPLGMLVVDPHLPSWLPDLRVEGIRVGRSRIDLELHRTKSGKTNYRVTRQEGNVRVIRQPPPQGPRTSMGKRASAAVASILRS